MREVGRATSSSSLSEPAFPCTFEGLGQPDSWLGLCMGLRAFAGAQPKAGKATPPASMRGAAGWWVGSEGQLVLQHGGAESCHVLGAHLPTLRAPRTKICWCSLRATTRAAACQRRWQQLPALHDCWPARVGPCAGRIPPATCKKGSCCHCSPVKLALPGRCLAQLVTVPRRFGLCAVRAGRVSTRNKCELRQRISFDDLRPAQPALHCVYTPGWRAINAQ